MAKNLVIVESPAKAKTIGKILGPDFSVMASMGHVRDLPKKKFAVNIRKNFEPEYVPMEGRKDLIAGLKKSAGASESIYLAPDPDREGEAIAWHLQCLLARSAGKAEFLRVSYNEITQRAVREAFEHPRKIDMKRVYAQQARRIVDRIVGYKVSPLLWTRVKRGLSAGRVQSVALRLICEREKLITDFVPQEYWLLSAKVRKLVDPRDPFVVRLAHVDGKKADVKSAEEANRILEDVRTRALRVGAIVTRDINRRPPPPFITSTLQQAMSSRYGLSAASTMRLAQKLYEGVDMDGETVGLITYMRTDSFSVAQDAVQACRGLIESAYGSEYLPEKPNFFKSRETSQGAHEAIRPTDVTRTPDKVARHLGPQELKVYRSIWERFVASQMKPAVIRQTTAEVIADPVPGRPTSYLFRATASEVTFPGYMKASGFVDPRAALADKADKEGAAEVARLPPLAEGEQLECDWLSERKETQPPARFSEGSLVRELEANGVGRPSTYAQILSTLIGRKYVIKEKRSLVPTPLGMQVNSFLVKSLDELFEVQFTAKMEEELDKIEDDMDWTGMVQEFYDKFLVCFEKAKGPPADPAKVRAILDMLAGVSEWAPPTTYGKREYSDQAFVASIREQLDKGEKPVSERQVQALARIACRYDGQVPGIRDAMVGSGLADAATIAAAQPPGPVILRKMELLSGVQCDAPSQRGKRVYDDRAFIESLARRTGEGRDLSPAQKVQVDRLLLKYSSQVQNFDQIKAELGVDAPSVAEDPEIATLFELMKHVKEWRPEAKRGSRSFSDKEFYESVRQQYARKRTLSPRQKAVLRRVAATYGSQIPGLAEVSARYGWRTAGRKASAEAESQPGPDESAAEIPE